MRTVSWALAQGLHPTSSSTSTARDVGAQLNYFSKCSMCSPTGSERLSVKPPTATLARRTGTRRAPCARRSFPTGKPGSQRGPTPSAQLWLQGGPLGPARTPLYPRNRALQPPGAHLVPGRQTGAGGNHPRTQAAGSQGAPRAWRQPSLRG